MSMLPPNSRIVDTKYIAKAKNTKDKIRRLGNLLEVLRDEDEPVEADSEEWPGLASLALELPELLKDSATKSISLLCCIEVLTIYAPHVVWEDETMLDIFRHLNRTINTAKPDLVLLERISHIRISCILTEMVQNETDGALEVLVEYLHNLLHSPRHDHPKEALEYMQSCVLATIEEFESGITIPPDVYDELLIAVESGKNLTILADTAGPKRSKKSKKLPSFKAPNPTYWIAATTIKTCVNKLANGIAEILNGILTHEPRFVENSKITNISEILYELNSISPQVLAPVLGTLSGFLSHADKSQRQTAVDTFGKLFLENTNATIFRAFCKRGSDIEEPIRNSVAKSLVAILEKSPDGEIRKLAGSTISEMLNDPNLDIRSFCIHSVSQLAYKNPPNEDFDGILQSISGRFSSKTKSERRDALTGIGYVYSKQFGTAVGLLDTELYSWMPDMILECVSYTDSLDSEMRSRVVQVVDEHLVAKNLSASVSFVKVYQSLSDKSKEFWKSLFQQRATLQRKLSEYIDARSALQKEKSGTESFLQAEAHCTEILGVVSQLTAPTKNVQKFHSIKDKHVFRLLSLITDPNHEAKSRERAIAELPKRMDGSISDWAVELAKRTAMGKTLNAEVLQGCVELARECWQNSQLKECKTVLDAIRFALEVFPTLLSETSCLEVLGSLLSACRKSTDKKANAILTQVSWIVSTSTASMKPQDSSSGLEKQLLHLCKDGTPEQTRHAVSALSHLYDESQSTTLLQTLTSSSNMKISEDEKEALKLVSTLSGLAALATKSPSVVAGSTRGKKAVKFAVDSILLGRSGRSDDESSAEESSDEESAPKRRSTSRSPKKRTSLLEDKSTSVWCRRLCAAIEFLVSYMRSVTLEHKAKPSGKSAIPTDLVPTVFKSLAQILGEGGVPLSRRDRALCGSRNDACALRRCAGESLVRLCDPRLGFEKQSLSLGMWQTIGSALLDDAVTVRENTTEELVQLLRGEGVYGKGAVAPKPPSLRFVSLVVLALGIENKGPRSAQNAVLHCIVNLRKVSDAMYAQCSAMGKAEQFERSIKMQLMPEYMVPYALFLLSHLDETPSSMKDDDAIAASQDVDDNDISDESSHRQLRRQLKGLLGALVTSLGDGADNISFLVRMVETIGKFYAPTQLPEPTKSYKSTPTKENAKQAKLLKLKLQVVCSTAREILLSFVKTDANISNYPGSIQVPVSLFKRTSPSSAPSTGSKSKRRKVTPSANTSSKEKRKNAGKPRSLSKSSKKIRPLASVEVPSVATNDSFADLSPIDKSDSPYFKGTVSQKNPEESPISRGETLGLTPPSGLRTATMQTASYSDVSKAASAARFRRSLERGEEPETPGASTANGTAGSSKKRASKRKNADMQESPDVDDAESIGVRSKEELKRGAPSGKRTGSQGEEPSAEEDSLVSAKTPKKSKAKLSSQSTVPSSMSTSQSTQESSALSSLSSLGGRRRKQQKVVKAKRKGDTLDFGDSDSDTNTENLPQARNRRRVRRRS